MDTATIRVVANLARKRAARAGLETHKDGIARLGAQRALEELAVDLEISAAELDRSAGKSPRS